MWPIKKIRLFVFVQFVFVFLQGELSMNTVFVFNGFGKCLCKALTNIFVFKELYQNLEILAMPYIIFSLSNH